jgi:acyl CoA:acetate/3-ketoacid CoA transferase alpha subunit
LLSPPQSSLRASSAGLPGLPLCVILGVLVAKWLIMLVQAVPC